MFHPRIGDHGPLLAEGKNSKQRQWASMAETFDPADQGHAAAMVERFWEEIDKLAEQALARPLIDKLEADLLTMRGYAEALREGSAERLDWEKAEIFHKLKMFQHEYFNQRVSEKCQYFYDRAKTNEEYGIKVKLAAFQINFAINSAVAIGAFNAILNTSNSKFLPIAIMALVFAILGAALTSAAHWQLSEDLITPSDVVQQHLSDGRSFEKLKMISQDIRFKPSRSGLWITQFSIGWTGTYLVGCVLWAMFRAAN